MQFSSQAFNAHLNNLGETFKWQASSACPCITPQSGSAKQGCPHCGGKGRLWAAPVNAKAGVASQKTQMEWAKLGQWESGDLVLAIPENSPMYDVAPYDRVISTTSSEKVSIPLIRGAVNERVPGTVKAIRRIFWFNAAGTIVEGSIPSLNDKGQPPWASGGPPVGTAYTVTYDRHQEFYCFGPMANNRFKHDGMRLPLRMVMRSFDLFGR